MITKAQTKELTNQLIDNMAKEMRKQLDRALESGAVDFDNYQPDYHLPRIILNGLIQDAMHEWSCPAYWTDKEKARFRRAAKNVYLNI